MGGVPGTNWLARLTRLVGSRFSNKALRGNNLQWNWRWHLRPSTGLYTHVYTPIHRCSHTHTTAIYICKFIIHTYIHTWTEESTLLFKLHNSPPKSEDKPTSSSTPSCSMLHLVLNSFPFFSRSTSTPLVGHLNHASLSLSFIKGWRTVKVIWK